MTLIFSSLIFHCAHREPHWMCLCILMLIQEIAHNLRISSEVRCKQSSIFLHNRNMATTVGSVYWYIHKCFICMQLLLSTFCHIKAFSPLRKRGAALCLNLQLIFLTSVAHERSFLPKTWADGRRSQIETLQNTSLHCFNNRIQQYYQWTV